MCPRRTIIILLQAISLLWSGSLSAQIVLSEIMFNPLGNERYDEFIEVYNASETSVIDVSGWLISDGAGFNTIVAQAHGSQLLPHSFAVIFVPGYFQQSHFYDTLLPVDALLLSIDKSAFGSYGLNNSRSERVSIFLPDTSLVDTYAYTVPNEEGISEEKINLYGFESPENWCHSLGVNGTPGRRNSTAPLAQNLTLMANRLTIRPVPIKEKDSVSISIYISNKGLETAEKYSLSLFWDENQDGEPQASESLAVMPSGLENITSLDSALISWLLPPFPAGTHTLWMFLHFPTDQDTSDNYIEFSLTVATPPILLIINEIYYNTEEKNQEWVELYNPSLVPVDVEGYRFKDASKTIVITDKNYRLSPDEYLLLSNSPLEGSSDFFIHDLVVPNLPELNNNGDQIALLSPAGVCIDSIAYTTAWGGGRFISLERIRWEDPGNEAKNWTSSCDSSGATPGRVNSCSPKARDATVIPGSLHIVPEKPMQGAPVQIACMVENAGRDTLINMKVVFYYQDYLDEQNNIGDANVMFLAPEQQQSVTVEWRAIPAGALMVCAEVQVTADERASNNEFCREIYISYSSTPVVINEIMYSPVEGQPEWIEFYNRCAGPIDLSHWCISDTDTLKKRQFSPSSLVLPSHGFLVASEDTSLLNFLPRQNVLFVVLREWPILGNDDDIVVLYDGAGKIVDQICYNNKWGGAKGRSLERLNPAQPTLEETNWTTCVAKIGHTAGAKNSVFFDILPPTVALDAVPVPFSPDGDGFEDHLAIHYCLPAQTAYTNIRIFDIVGRMVRFLCNYEPSGSERTVFWDGLDADNQRCRMGIYVIHLEAFDEARGRLIQAKKVCVLASHL